MTHVILSGVKSLLDQAHEDMDQKGPGKAGGGGMGCMRVGTEAASGRGLHATAELGDLPVQHNPATY